MRVNESLTAGEACKVRVSPTSGFKWRTFELGFSTDRSLISASAAPHCGALQKTRSTVRTTKDRIKNQHVQYKCHNQRAFQRTQSTVNTCTAKDTINSRHA